LLDGDIEKLFTKTTDVDALFNALEQFSFKQTALVKAIALPYS
jgi:hypothetical protein